MEYRIEKQPERNAREGFRGVGKISLPLLGALLILAAGCVEDDLYKTPHPGKGAVIVTADWSGRSSDAAMPDTYVLRIGEKEQRVSRETNAFDGLFLPGRQDLLVHHQPEGMKVSGTAATVDTLPDGTLEPMPGDLFSGIAALDIIKDDTLRVTVPMRQHTRRLTLTLQLNPGDEQRIAGTSATLTGIASTVDLISGAITSSGGKVTVPVFVLGTENGMRAPGQPVLVATLRLLGVMEGEKQTLTLDLALKDGTVQTLATDLTDALTGFGTGADMEPLMLDAALALPEGNTEGAFGGTITGWTEVDNGDIGIH